MRFHTQHKTSHPLFRKLRGMNCPGSGCKRKLYSRSLMQAFELSLEKTVTKVSFPSFSDLLFQLFSPQEEDSKMAFLNHSESEQALEGFYYETHTEELDPSFIQLHTIHDEPPTVHHIKNNTDPSRVYPTPQTPSKTHLDIYSPLSPSTILPHEVSPPPPAMFPLKPTCTLCLRPKCGIEAPTPCTLLNRMGLGLVSLASTPGGRPKVGIFESSKLPTYGLLQCGGVALGGVAFSKTSL